MKRQSSLKDFFNNKRQNTKDDSDSPSLPLPDSDCTAAEQDDPTSTPNSCRTSEDPKSATGHSSEKTVEAKPIGDAIMLETIQSCFDVSSNSGKFHSFYHCNRKCSTLSSDEKNTQSKLTHKFNHQWLCDKELSYCSETGIYWLTYDEEAHGMYCILCRKHDAGNDRNKTKAFNLEPGRRFRKAAVEDHRSSKQHRSAVTAELVRRVSCFHKEFEEYRKHHDDALFNVFSACYFLAKEEIANCKIIPLLELLEQTGVTNLKHFHHRSPSSIREMFITLGETIKDAVLQRVHEARTYGLLVDDASDIAVMEQMVTFISYVNHETSTPQVDFLSITNVLEDAGNEGANSRVLFKELLQQLGKCELEVTNLTSLVTDGAAVMTGSRGGLATLLKEVSNRLIAIHCICHRLSLACVKSNDQTKYLTVVETVLYQLWKFFENSPKRSAKYMHIQLEYKTAVAVSGEKEKAIVRKIRKACRTRWLSLDKSVEAVYLDFVPVLQTLQFFSESDAVATGLLKKMKTAQFVGAIYILRNILPILSTLSRVFQYGTVNFSRIRPALQASKAALQEVVDSGVVLAELRKDLDERLALIDIHPSPYQYDMISRMLDQYVSALKENIDKRFDEALPVISSFSIFDPLAVPSSDVSNYGLQEVDVLGGHFYPSDDDREKLRAEWANFRFELREWQSMATVKHGTSTPTEWVLQRLVSMKDTYCRVYPKLYFIAEACAAMPVSNSWPERGVSTMRRVKTRLRSSLKNDMLEALMHVSINGPPTSSTQAKEIISQAVKRWKGVKGRRRLPDGRTCDRVTMVDAQVQTGDGASVSGYEALQGPTPCTDADGDTTSEGQHTLGDEDSTQDKELMKALNLSESSCSESEPEDI